MNLLKTLKPKTLLGRLILILFISTVFIEGIGVFLFVNRTTLLYSKKVLSSVASLIYLIQDLQTQKRSDQWIEKLVYKNFGFVLTNVKTIPMHTSQPRYKNPFLIAYTYRYLTSIVKNPNQIYINSHIVTIYFPKKYSSQYMALNIPTEELFTDTVYLVIAWLIIAPILFGIIALILIRNQLRPLKKLVKKSLYIEKHGIEPANLHVRGASEVRQTLLTFNQMTQSLSTRSQENAKLLKSVGNSIIEPLTIARTQLELEPQTEQIQKLKSIIDKTQKNIGKLLVLTSLNLKNEPQETLNLKTYLHAILSQWTNQLVRVHIDSHQQDVFVLTPPIQLQYTLFQALTFLSYTTSDLNISFGKDPTHIMIQGRTAGYHKQEGKLIDSIDYHLLSSTFQLLNIKITLKQEQNLNKLQILFFAP